MADRETESLAEVYRDRKACSDVPKPEPDPRKLDMSNDLYMSAAARRLLETPVKSDEELAADEAFRLDKERDRQLSKLMTTRGARYANCTFESFETPDIRQHVAMIAVRDATEGVIIYGPKGTGKDHLMMAKMRDAVLSGKRVEWYTGADLFGEVRDRIESRDSEREFVSRLGTVDVLAISDPVPPVGTLTPHQANMLYRIIDRRYSSALPTWITCNATTSAELETAIGAATADRIRDGAVTVFCNWPSYRQTVTD